MSEVRLLITGASGWVGQYLHASACERGFAVRAGVRHDEYLAGCINCVLTPSLGERGDWGDAMAQCQVLIHLAARVHMMQDASANPLVEYRRINTEGTLHLARQAAQSGIKRFIFISSVKVNGEQTFPGHPFRATDTPAPQDPYGISKMEAEDGLRAIARETGMEVVIIRPPLVYGPGVKANFAAMVRSLQRGLPLPLGAIHNQRSLVALDNLVDLIMTCIHHPAAANQTFMVSDGQDVSTTELLRLMARALGRPARLLPVPPGLLEWGAALVGKKAVAQRLCSSLQVDMEATRRILGWTPPLTLEQGLQAVATPLIRPT